jgi:membrane fusion protein (multidrug efflux system)
MYVRARIKQGIDTDALAVPQQAIQRTSDGKAEVWVVREDSKVMLQPVEVGSVVGNQWIIRSGLKAGDRVVVEGVQKIVAGQEVKTVEIRTAADDSEPKPRDTDTADADADPKAGRPKADPTKGDPTKAEAAKSDPAKSDSAKSDPTKGDGVKPVSQVR